MSDKVAPGSAGHGLYRATPGGVIYFDPQGGDGAWPEGVTETRLRGLVRDATGRLSLADLARVDVARATADPAAALADIFAVPGTEGGAVLFRPGYMWQDSGRVVAAGPDDPIGYLDPFAGDLNFMQTDALKRPVMQGGASLVFDGTSVMSMLAPGYHKRNLVIAMVLESPETAQTTGILSSAPLSGPDWNSPDGFGALLGLANGSTLQLVYGGLSRIANDTVTPAPLAKSLVGFGILETGGGWISVNGVVTASDTTDSADAVLTGPLHLGARAANGAAHTLSEMTVHGGLIVASGRIFTESEKATMAAVLLAEGGLA